MSLIKSGFSALGKLLLVAALAAAFLFGLAGVVYMSLQGEEIKVPEITGKDFVESEKELAAMGLKIKRRAERFSTEKPNTILEQLPKPGETVKTGQMILVVISKFDALGQETPTSLKQINEEEDDTEKIEEMISDKPKKTNKNANTAKKKGDTSRDVISSKSKDNSASNSGIGIGDSNNKNTGSGGTGSKIPPPPPLSNKLSPPPPSSNKTAPAKPPTGGDVRPRATPKP